MKKIIIQKRLYKYKIILKKPSIKEINKVSNKVSTKKMTKDTDNKSTEVIDKSIN